MTHDIARHGKRRLTTKELKAYTTRTKTDFSAARRD